MMHYIGIDTASEVCAATIISTSGRTKQRTLLATDGVKLRSFVKSIPRPRTVIFEEGNQAAWLYSILEPLSDDVLVCDPVKNKEILRRSKGDVMDADKLAEWGRLGMLSRVWHGGQQLQMLKETLRTYQELTKHSTRIKNQIKAVFRSRGVKISSGIYDPNSYDLVGLLPHKTQQERVVYLKKMLEVTTEQRMKARKELINLARRSPMFAPVKSIDGFGDILTAFFVAEVGSPFRFRSRKQFWAYCGLSVVTHASSEYENKSGKIQRKSNITYTRGLVRACNTTLKYVFKHAAFTASANQLAKQYKNIEAGTKNRANAQLTLARKLAAVALRIAKTGKKYDVKLAFK